MKGNYFIQLIILILLIACMPNEPYLQYVIAKRIEKDHMFKTSDESPFDDTGKQNFSQLVYYDYNTKFRVKARMEKHAVKDTVWMLTTQSLYKNFLYEGDLKFRIESQDFSLRAYQALFYEADHYFVPFTDLTTGQETYETGRYLEVKFQNGNEYIVDFNMAYNPYCMYNFEKYNCPIPPEYNKLAIRIEAGEKRYEN